MSITMKLLLILSFKWGVTGLPTRRRLGIITRLDEGATETPISRCFSLMLVRTWPTKSSRDYYSFDAVNIEIRKSSCSVLILVASLVAEVHACRSRERIEWLRLMIRGVRWAQLLMNSVWLNSIRSKFE
jgi:hypothetical protein